jgi:methionine biosynthesis protein MetW
LPDKEIVDSTDKSWRKIVKISKGHATEWVTAASLEAWLLIKSDLMEQLPQKPKMLDLGCGGGQLMEKCKGLGFSIAGVDAASMAVDICKGRGLSIIQHDLNQPLPFSDREFDLVTCIKVIEHLFNPASVLSEVRRITKDDGFLVISAPNEYEWLQRLRFLLGKPIDWHPWSPTTHLHKSNITQFINFVKEENWDVVKLHPFMVSGRRYLPMRLQKTLVSRIPNLFAGDMVGILRKKR